MRPSSSQTCACPSSGEPFSVATEAYVQQYGFSGCLYCRRLLRFRFRPPQRRTLQPAAAVATV
jgi:hypothetical protein